MTINNSFFSNRRSVTAKKMTANPINPEDLEIILAAGIRVPDHGALNPVSYTHLTLPTKA